MTLDIRNCDNMDLMREFPDKHFELAICDPPYNIKFGNYNRTIKASSGKCLKADKYKNSDWDNKIPDDEYFKELFRVSKNQIIWGGNYFPYLWTKGCRGFIFWFKGNPVPNFSDGEFAWTSFDRNAKQLDLRYYGNLEGGTKAEEKIHPTQKSTLLYKWLLETYAKPGDKILDTHLGSMSIAIACHYLGYDLTGCELDKDYYEAGMKRVKQETSQLSFL